MSSSPHPQRRAAFRVGMTGGRVRVERASGETTAFTLRDLSVSGVRLIGATRLAVDEPITIGIELGDETIELSARVVRVDGYGCGVEFGPIALPVETRIGRYLADEQRRRVRPRD